MWALGKPIRTLDMGGPLINFRPTSSHCSDICKIYIIEVGTASQPSLIWFIVSEGLSLYFFPTMRT